MKIYTKTGDTGETGLLGAPRVRKDSPRIEAYGAVDELNAAIGVARATELPSAMQAELAEIQAELFCIGGELATPDPAKFDLRIIGPPHVARLEAIVDRYEATLPPLKNFILPGGSPGAAALHVARTVCRRAERRLVSLLDQSAEPISEQLVIYLNRLGDLLFVLARAANAAAGVADVVWQKPAADA